jgi:hypothetical protein
MDILLDRKLQNLLHHWPTGLVATAPWLNKFNISEQLRQSYLKGKWIESLGYGAFKKTEDIITWKGAVAGFQNQLINPIHIGGATALSIYGVNHYVKMGKERVFLFSNPGQKLPKWFLNYDWGNKIEFIKSSFLPNHFGINQEEYNGFLLNISSRERAIMECLYLAPDNFDLVECYQLLEILNNIRPSMVQNLLSECSSIKAKRLFLYMAKKADLPVLKYLDISKIDLGSGVRSLDKQNGVYNAEFKLVIPRELEEYV